MRLEIEGYVPKEDLDALKRLGGDWCDEITYVPVFHPECRDDMALLGFGQEPVKVRVRIEVEGGEEEKDVS